MFNKMNLRFERSNLFSSDTTFAGDLFMRSAAVPRMQNRAIPLKTDLKSIEQNQPVFKATF